MIWLHLMSTAVQTFIAGSVMGAVVLPALHYFLQHLPQWFLLWAFRSAAGPMWVQVAAVFLLTKANYWIHRWQHWH